MNLMIYKNDFERIGIVDQFKSLIWHRKFFTSGIFQIVAPATENNLELLKKRNIIHKPGRKDAGYIDSVTIANAEDGEWITASGYFLTGLLARRVIPQQTNISGTYESIMRSLVENNAISAREIPYLSLGTLNGYTEAGIVQIIGENLLTYLGKLAQVSNTGFYNKFSRNGMTFETYKGVDHSAEQSVNPRVVFSEDYDNLGGSEYNNSEATHISTAFVLGEFDGVESLLEVGSDATGWDRFETFVNAGQISNNNGEITEDGFLEILTEKGQEAFKPIVENFNGTVQTDSASAVYGKDYDLGDIVTVFSKKWNIKISVRVTEIEEVDDETGSFIVPYFGATEPALSDILKAGVY